MLDEQLEDLTESTGTRYPHYVKGKTQGFKIVGVRPTVSTASRCSWRPIPSVNGEQISSLPRLILEAEATSQVTIDMSDETRRKPSSTRSNNETNKPNPHTAHLNRNPIHRMAQPAPTTGP